MNDNLLTLLEWKWFNSLYCIGIVFAFDRKTNIYHGYLGMGAGNNEERDCYHIINHGFRLTREQTSAMLGSEKAKKLISGIPYENWKV